MLALKVSSILQNQTRAFNGVHAVVMRPPMSCYRWGGGIATRSVIDAGRVAVAGGGGGGAAAASEGGATGGGWRYSHRAASRWIRGIRQQGSRGGRATTEVEESRRGRDREGPS